MEKLEKNLKFDDKEKKLQNFQNFEKFLQI